MELPQCARWERCGVIAVSCGGEETFLHWASDLEPEKMASILSGSLAQRYCRSWCLHCGVDTASAMFTL